ncbi:methionyl-tRNA formyltransferase [Tautonia plasticadhaerens]|uniref:Methionyl-tRNA formyltransferase n=1 Tax=Tautonia plasticadhaerens TaxID=2527974 RepID=A0A518H159_9BACT|nr:methionyl-tRNA formyltransferase [Tautonia plasticadhaerens]QDV34567.1 Methionyl-tRNA formyltransferase [Tautonia plasticadhaerens]
MPPPLRLVMLGTKDFALPTFLALLKTGHEVVALVTQPDRPQGRKQELIPSRIKAEAVRLGVRVEQPKDVNAPEGVELIRSMRPDLLVTAAYGQILSAELLGAAPRGGINLHGSVLPKYRGAAPVARAIQEGESETGVTVIAMSPRVDAGGMIAVARTPIGPDETAGELEERLARLGAPLVVEAVDALAAGAAEVIPQDPALATKAPKLRKESGVIDWSRSARRIHDLVRAMQPWPASSTHWHPSGPGKPPVRLIVHRAMAIDGVGEPGRVIAAGPSGFDVAAGSGAVRLVTLQVPGRKAMPAAEFLRGHAVQPGDLLGPDSPGSPVAPAGESS